MRTSLKSIARHIAIAAAVTMILPAAYASINEAEQLADKLMEYRLPDGGILVSPTSEPRARLVPYFSNLAALGWTETARMTTDTDKRTAYLDATRSWLDWYETHQNPDGTIYDFEGTATSLEPTGTYDSTDSYAATYAIVMLRYYEVTQDKDYLRKKLPSLDGAYDAIHLTMDQYGLTYAHPHYAYRFLMDNCEVAAGFAAFQHIYTILEQPDKAARASRDLTLLKDQFSRFYLPHRNAFAYAVDPFNTRVGNFTRGYPDAMANLFAITFLAPPAPESTALLNTIKEQFWDKEDSQNFPQWWLWPAMICGDADLQAGALAKLKTQADSPTAHSYLVGMTAATIATGIDSLRFPEVVCTWPQLTRSHDQAAAAPSSDSLITSGSNIILTGHKSKGTIAGEWFVNNPSLPLAIDYDITTATGYFQVNLVWPTHLDLIDYAGFELKYDNPAAPDTQLQVTLVEPDGDWWDAPMPAAASTSGTATARIDFASLTPNRWGRKGDGKLDLARCSGIRFQIANSSGDAIAGTVRVISIDLYKAQGSTDAK